MTTTSTTPSRAAGTTPTTAAVLPAAVARMQPNTDTQQLFTDVLAGTRLSDYWPLLADMLAYAITDIHTAHTSQCRRRDCRTCTAIRDATAWIGAHHNLNNTPCGCHPGCGHHHHIPHPTRGFQL